MSVHVVPITAGPSWDPWPDQLTTMITTGIRAPTSRVRTADNNGVAYTFIPDLSPAEISVFDACVAAAASGTGLGHADYDAIRSQMQTLRAMRQQGRNAYVNLTEAERNRQTWDCLDAITEIFIRLTRT